MENIRRAISAALWFFKSNLLWTEMEPLSTTLRPNSAPSGNERHQGTQHFAVLVCDIERPIQGETLEVSISITYMDDGTCITNYILIMCRSWHSSSFRVSTATVIESWTIHFGSANHAVKAIGHCSIPSRFSDNLQVHEILPIWKAKFQLSDLKNLGMWTNCKSPPHWNHQTPIVSPPDMHLESTKASAFNISLEVIGATCPKRALRIWQPSWGLGYGILLGNFEWLYLHTQYLCAAYIQFGHAIHVPI